MYIIRRLINGVYYLLVRSGREDPWIATAYLASIPLIFNVGSLLLIASAVLEMMSPLGLGSPILFSSKLLWGGVILSVYVGLVASRGKLLLSGEEGAFMARRFWHFFAWYFLATVLLLCAAVYFFVSVAKPL